MSGDALDPYDVILSGQAKRNLSESLPFDVAAAAIAAIENAIAVNPHRVGKPLNEPFEGCYAARRGTYRIIYRIHEPKHVIEILSIRHRRDSCRP